MNIVVNTQLLLPDRLEGLGWFTFETMSRITRMHPEHTFYFVFDRPWDKRFVFADNVKPIIMSPPSRHPVLWYLRFEWLLPRLLKKLNADLYLSPDGWSSLRTKVPCIQVIHDLNYEHNPDDVPFLIRHYFRYFFPRFALSAAHLATVSAYSKADIVKTYGIPENKVTVVYNGCNTIYKPLPESENETTRQKYSEGAPYFLYVGALLPRKNIQGLFEAYDMFRRTDTHGVKLLIVGEKMWWTPAIARAYESMQHKNDVVFLGRLQTPTLHKVYAAALALTFVPHFEGFGIPIIEAFNCGVPVITSNCTSMPEIADGAALLVNPADVSCICAAMHKIATDPVLREKLIGSGHKRKLDFSWDITAQKLWNCIDAALYNKI